MTILEAHVKELVCKLQQEGKSYSGYELEHQFEGKWKEWINSFTTNGEQLIEYLSDGDIEEEIVKILRHQLRAHDDLIIQKLLTIPLNERNCSSKFFINKDVHLTSTRWLSFGSLGSSDIAIAKDLTEKCLTSAHDLLNTITMELKPFTSNFACEVLKDLFKSIDDVMKTENTGFKFKPEYKVDVAIAISASASNVFKQTTKKLKDSNPIFKLNEIKVIFLNMFKDLYKGVNRSSATTEVSDTREQKVNKIDTPYLFIILPLIFIVIAIAWLYNT